jgi:hypothetical protein
VGGNKIWRGKKSRKRKKKKEKRKNKGIRLSALMDLYIHPLYILVIKILSSILNSSTSIYPLYHLLSTVGPTCHFI